MIEASPKTTHDPALTPLISPLLEIRAKKEHILDYYTMPDQQNDTSPSRRGCTLAVDTVTDSEENEEDDKENGSNKIFTGVIVKFRETFSACASHCLIVHVVVVCS
ncbi:hypothetical protein WISP_16937 [Willisornis vidua]|uniref:Uncharacterized protein n=1 Tax=Willisornis vidua TaxID=1566151 RepID=A0ABQ9DU30_9PASS|nr:hypothetical protein WISP_16937 [Willisornis vidua]